MGLAHLEPLLGSDCVGFNLIVLLEVRVVVLARWLTWGLVMVGLGLFWSIFLRWPIHVSVGCCQFLIPYRGGSFHWLGFMRYRLGQMGHRHDFPGRFPGQVWCVVVGRRFLDYCW